VLARRPRNGEPTPTARLRFAGLGKATLVTDDQTRTLTGTGYHGHNWCDAAMPQLIHHWYWVRAEAGGVTAPALWELMYFGKTTA
jgi:hypothetical protein